MPVDEEYKEKTENLLKSVSGKDDVTPETDDSQRKPSTGNPRDYLYVQDFSDIGKGRQVCISTITMPKEADEAFHLWRQSKASKSGESYIEPSVKAFEEVMGFSVTSLEDAKAELEKDILGK